MNTTTTQAKLTQCPHCQSVFEVSEEEMQPALGAVRCGECMKIFNANYHLINTPETATLTEQVTTPQPPEDKTDNAEKNTHLQTAGIPTLQEHPQDLSADQPNQKEEEEELTSKDEQDALYIDTLLRTDKADSDETEQASEPEQEAAVKPQKKRTQPLIAGLITLIVALLIGGWYYSNTHSPSYYEFSEVRLSPSNNPKKMDVHFRLTNISQQKLALPNLNIQLLNLSSQPISSEIINASDLQTNLSELESGSSQTITVSVNRPRTFVQSARIQVYLEDTKL